MKEIINSFIQGLIFNLFDKSIQNNPIVECNNIITDSKTLTNYLEFNNYLENNYRFFQIKQKQNNILLLFKSNKDYNGTYTNLRKIIMRDIQNILDLLKQVKYTYLVFIDGSIKKIESCKLDNKYLIKIKSINKEIDFNDNDDILDFLLDLIENYLVLYKSDNTIRNLKDLIKKDLNEDNYSIIFELIQNLLNKKLYLILDFIIDNLKIKEYIGKDIISEIDSYKRTKFDNSIDFIFKASILYLEL